ncbi:MAG: hypothetical protein GDA39_03840, partial [Hyphomonadaceae bacterium]|nr:hypothetical protein [Hyphomonadaceae bacterium]
MKHHLVLLGAAVFGITACGTASDRGAGPTVIAPVPIRTCTPRQELERVVIPAKTEKFYAITEIANP